MRPLLRLAASLLVASALATTAAAQDAGPALGQPIPPVVQAWAAAWNGYDAPGMAALFTEEGVYRDEAFGATFTGREAVADWVGITAAAIPEAELEIVDAFQSGDRVAVRWVFHGTPERFGPIEATGRSFSVPAVTIMDLEDGLIAHLTDTYNLADVFRQVGLDADDWVPPDP